MIDRTRRKFPLTVPWYFSESLIRSIPFTQIKMRMGMAIFEFFFLLQVVVKSTYNLLYRPLFMTLADKEPYFQVNSVDITFKPHTRRRSDSNCKLKDRLLNIILHSYSWFPHPTTTGNSNNFVSRRITSAVRVIFVVMHATRRRISP